MVSAANFLYRHLPYCPGQCRAVPCVRERTCEVVIEGEILLAGAECTDRDVGRKFQADQYRLEQVVCCRLHRLSVFFADTCSRVVSCPDYQRHTGNGCTREVSSCRGALLLTGCTRARTVLAAHAAGYDMVWHVRYDLVWHARLAWHGMVW